MNKQTNIYTMTIIPIILCGGIGTRLWPESNATNPKPFIQLQDGLSFLQKTYLRIDKIPRVTQIVTVTNDNLLDKTINSYNELKLTNIKHHTYIVEPIGRNTAPAIATVALYLQQLYPNATLLTFPADHLIENEDLFIQKIKQAVELAQNKSLVTFGIKPTYPETGYGYIEFINNQVKRFVEKPDLLTAKNYVNSQKYLWNSGMLCFTINTMLAEFTKHAPHILNETKIALAKAILATYENTSCTTVKLPLAEFSQIHAKSIDYAIMERTSEAKVIECDIGWNDVGCWDTLGKLLAQTIDENGNHLKGEIYLNQVKNSIILGNKKTINVIGLKNIIIVDHDDALLIINKDNIQDVKNICL